MSYPKVIQEQLDAIESFQRATLEAVERVRNILDILPEAYVHLDFGGRVSVSVESGDELRDILHGLRAKGYVTRSAPDKKAEYGIGTITWILLPRGASGKDPTRAISVQRRIGGSGDACKVVKVGSKQVDVPIWELQCPDEDNYDGPSEAEIEGMALQAANAAQAARTEEP